MSEFCVWILGTEHVAKLETLVRSVLADNSDLGRRGIALRIAGGEAGYYGPVFIKRDFSALARRLPEGRQVPVFTTLPASELERWTPVYWMIDGQRYLLEKLTGDAGEHRCELDGAYRRRWLGLRRTPLDPPGTRLVAAIDEKQLGGDRLEWLFIDPVRLRFRAAEDASRLFSDEGRLVLDLGVNISLLPPTQTIHEPPAYFAPERCAVRADLLRTLSRSWHDAEPACVELARWTDHPIIRDLLLDGARLRLAGGDRPRFGDAGGEIERSAIVLELPAARSSARLSTNLLVRRARAADALGARAARRAGR